MTAPLHLLAITAHPDDELGCAGTLIRTADAGRAVGIVDLTAGERSTRGERDTRAAERDRATELLGLATRVGLRLPDAGIDGSARQREALVDALRQLRPRIVLAPFPHDRHPDHGAAGRLARDACFLAAIRRYAAGAPHRPAAVYHYLLHEPFKPTFVIDVTDVWARAREAIGAYVSQFDEDPGERSTPLQQGFLATLEARATWFGAMIGVERGEPFWSAGPLGFDEPPDRALDDAYRMFV